MDANSNRMQTNEPEYKINLTDNFINGLMYTSQYLFMLILFVAAKLCNRKIGCGNKSYKYLKWMFFVCHVVWLLIYVLLFATGLLQQDNFNIVIIYYQGAMVGVGLLMPFFPACYKKTPRVCCGRRFYCFFKQTDKSLAQTLQEIDTDITPDEELVFLKQKCLRYVESFRMALQKTFASRALATVEMVGSTTERFGLPMAQETVRALPINHALLSDYDLMFSFNGWKASEEGGVENPANDSHFFTVITKDFRLHPGFVKLLLTEHGLARFKSAYNDASLDAPYNKLFTVTKDLEYLLNADAMKKALYSALSGTELDSYPEGRNDARQFNTAQVVKQGPAVNLTVGATNVCGLCMRVLFLADCTFSIKTEWPAAAADWAEQTRCWPSTKDIARIVKNGCHVVPKSQRSDKIGLTWRYSFSMAEVELSKLVNPIARKCFLVLKVIFKDHLQPCAKWLSSYHLKTVFFHTMSATSADKWTSQNAELCFRVLVRRLMTAVENQMCPHFWISDINLFDIEGVSVRHFNRLHSKIEQIMEHPHWYVKPYKNRSNKHKNDRNEDYVLYTIV